MSEVAAREKSQEDVEVMDTPEKSKSGQIDTSLSNFEDSPVFNFLNSLSPIKPFKSVHMAQTINPLNLASLASVFASPPATLFGESRFLRRHQLPDPSKPEFAFVDENKDRGDEPNTDAGKRLKVDETTYPSLSNGDVTSLDPSSNSSMFMVESNQDYNVQEASQKFNGSYHDDRNKEVVPCDDWESLMDASDLWIFQSPDVDSSSEKPVDRRTKIYASIENNMIQMQSQQEAASVTEGNETENVSTQPRQCNDDVQQNIENFAGCSINNPGENMECEHIPGIYRGTRRRRLLFEAKHSSEDSDSSSELPQYEASDSINERHLVLANQGNESSRCLLPGIGLHLNSISASDKIINRDVPSASGRLLTGHGPSVDFRVSSSGQELLNDVVSVERENVGISPTKKRRREQTGEVEACKRCNCKKSKCLKLYCECFAAGVYCVEPCACVDCFNKPIHEDTVLATRKQIESQNPLAFAPKVIRGSDQLLEIGDDSAQTPASARHKRGCNCKKSGCLKRYCECYQGGVGCSINCRCQGCKNAFGRKDGSALLLEAEEDETDKNENIDSQTPSTPPRPVRHLIPLPFSSKNKPLQSPVIGSSSSSFASFCTNPGYENPIFFPPLEFDKHFETIDEEGEIPGFLLENSQIGGIKSSSPNGKRVSPPRNGGGMLSQGLRCSRKFILHSIPSSPSLTSNQ